MEPSDREAWFKQTVQDHMGIFLKTAHGFAANAADRDDLVQEMLLSTWQALPGYQPAACKLTPHVSLPGCPQPRAQLAALALPLSPETAAIF
jgi:hypothetical protein